MKDTLTCLVFIAACYGAYEASLKAYVAVRRDFGNTMYRASRDATEDVMRYDAEFLLPIPPEARRNFRDN